ncbi:MAG: hypothetical protein ABJE95_39020 [Byssovorax sp.]
MPSSSRRFPLGLALVAGLAIFAQSPRARAEPTPAATPIAPAIPPSRPGPRRLDGAAPAYEVPTYVYFPGAGMGAMPGAPEIAGKGAWYGWQTLLVLGGSTTVGLVGGFAGGGSGSGGVLIGGLSIGGAGLLLGGPIVHWAHGNTSKGLAALGLNFGVPVVGGGLGVATACIAGGCGSGSEGVGILLGLMIGGSAGLLTSMILDVSVLAYEPVDSNPSVTARRAPTWTLVPDLKITRDKTTFGFAGVF